MLARWAPFLSAAPLFGGILWLVEPQSEEVKWLNPPERIERLSVPPHSYDKAIAHPALESAVKMAGEARFQFRPKGRHLVEVFLAVADEGKSSFVLEANGKAVDDRYQVRPGPARLRPRRGLRRVWLLGIIEGPATLVVRTDSSDYRLSAVRWTTEEEFEDRLVGRWRERARHLLVQPLFEGQEGGPQARSRYLEQLCQRLYLSRDEHVKREALIGLTRAYYWVAAENHEPAEIERLRELFVEALQTAPEDKVLRQMVSSACLGLNVGRARSMPQGPFCEEVKPIEWTVEVPPDPPGAPEWAATQRRLSRRMDAITRWWVEVRQQPHGELGGGWGDDVEILRNWGPQALGLGSVAAARGLAALADGLWNSGTLANGYDKGISDVEHSSEPTTDTQPLLAALFPDDEKIRDRLRETAECAKNWIVRQPDGNWRFRSSWFNCREADTSPSRAVDVHLNMRALGPALWYAYLTREAWIVDLLEKWGESWLKAMRSQDRGKPAGAIPSVLRSADGSYLISSDAWDKPNAEWDYYQWSGGSQEAMASLFLTLEDLTGKPKWLQAASESFRLLERCGEFPRLCEEIKGSPEAHNEWARRRGEKSPADDDGVLAGMARQAREMEKRLAVNFDMYTSEVLYTDRVYYALPGEYRQRLFGGEAPRGERYPAFAVTWDPSAEEYARAVLESTPQSLRLRAYNFEAKAVTARLRTWRLKPGKYTLEAAGVRRAVTVTQLPQVIEIELPPRQEVTVRIGR